jgi:hypothetical protein
MPGTPAAGANGARDRRRRSEIHAEPAIGSYDCRWKLRGGRIDPNGDALGTSGGCRNITERELVRRFNGMVWPELVAAAVANYREILCNTVRRWAGAIVNGYATEKTIVEELGVPANVVSATIDEYERAYGGSPSRGSRRGRGRFMRPFTRSNRRTSGYLAR